MNMNGDFEGNVDAPMNTGDASVGAANLNMDPMQAISSDNTNSSSSSSNVNATSDLQNEALLQSFVVPRESVRAREISPGQQDEDDESAKKRLKVEHPQQFHAASSTGSSSGGASVVLNSGMGSAANHVNAGGSGMMAQGNNNPSMGLYDSMALMGNAFATPSAVTTGAVPQTSMGGVGSSASPMDFNMFLQSMPMAYSSMPPAMMMMGSNAVQQQRQQQQQQQQQQQKQQQQQQEQLQLQQRQQQQIQQQRQQQQIQFLNQQRQYAASVAASQRGIPAMRQQQQPPQSQATMLATMLQQQHANNNNRAAVAAALQSKQQLMNSSAPGSGVQGSNDPVNVHAASVMSPHHQQQQQQQVPPAITAQPASTAAPAPQLPVQPVVVDAACLLCKEKGNVFTCNGGCGLHVHRACIGEEVLFPFLGTW